MEIVTISMDRKTLKELEHTQERFGFKSRSKLIRATINSLLNEYKALDALKGHSDAVFTVTYKNHEGKELAYLLERFEDVIRTEIHQHHAGTCLRILVSCGDAGRLRDLFAALKKEKGVRSVNCSIL